MVLVFDRRDRFNHNITNRNVIGLLVLWLVSNERAVRLHKKERSITKVTLGDYGVSKRAISDYRKENLHNRRC